jgi:hypothetical protein
VKLNIRLLSVATVLAAVGGSLAQAETGRPNSWGYDYPRAYDAEIAAPEVHRVRYEDSHIQFMEVSNPPGYHMQMHGHPYPSVFARMSGGVTATGLAPNERYLDPKSMRNGQGWRSAAPPEGAAFPTCTAADPQAPHLPVNTSDTPLHFYRVEFKRIDNDDPGAMTARYSKRAAERVLYESAAARLVEVTIPAGGASPRRDHTLAGVLAFDTEAAFDAADAALGKGPGRSPPPVGMVAPRCITLAADQLAPVSNPTDNPLHFYRIDFKRIDGPGLKDHWRAWYPFMLKMH